MFAKIKVSCHLMTCVCLPLITRDSICDVHFYDHGMEKTFQTKSSLHKRERERIARVREEKSTNIMFMKT